MGHTIKITLHMAYDFLSCLCVYHILDDLYMQNICAGNKPNYIHCTYTFQEISFVVYIFITRIMISVIVRISTERNRVEAKEESNMDYSILKPGFLGFQNFLF